MTDLWEDLNIRGLVSLSTKGLEERLAEGPIQFYMGIDLTGKSLHVGHLLGLITMMRFEKAGHRPVVVLGDATASVGDPSGRSTERDSITDEEITMASHLIRSQVMSITAFPWTCAVSNSSWLRKRGLLEFLSTEGKSISMSTMLNKESVKARLENQFMSFAEFSYMILQGLDFKFLFENKQAQLQVGGTDQWGNMLMGLDLIESNEAHAFAWPLMTNADGSKMGKTTGARIWLDQELTTPWEFYNHWMNVSDDEVEELLLKLTFLDTTMITRDLMETHRRHPHERLAQTMLADEITSIVHGRGTTEAIRESNNVLFGKSQDIKDLSHLALTLLESQLDGAVIPKDELHAGVSLLDVLVAVNLAESKGAARRLIEQNGIKINGSPVTDVKRMIDERDLLDRTFILFNRGKKHFAMVTCGN